MAFKRGVAAQGAYNGAAVQLQRCGGVGFVDEWIFTYEGTGECRGDGFRMAVQQPAADLRNRVLQMRSAGATNFCLTVARLGPWEERLKDLTILQELI